MVVANRTDNYASTLSRSEPGKILEGGGLTPVSLSLSDSPLGLEARSKRKLSDKSSLGERCAPGQSARDLHCSESAGIIQTGRIAATLQLAHSGALLPAIWTLLNPYRLAASSHSTSVVCGLRSRHCDRVAAYASRINECFGKAYPPFRLPPRS